MNKFSNLTDKDIHWLWDKELIMPSDMYDFRTELVRRGFVSWDEINTKFECVEIN